MFFISGISAKGGEGFRVLLDKNGRFSLKIIRQMFQTGHKDTPEKTILTEHSSLLWYANQATTKPNKTLFFLYYQVFLLVIFWTKLTFQMLLLMFKMLYSKK